MAINRLFIFFCNFTFSLEHGTYLKNNKYGITINEYKNLINKFFKQKNISIALTDKEMGIAMIDKNELNNLINDDIKIYYMMFKSISASLEI